MSHHLLEFKDVRYRYPDGTEALKGISFLITHGESVGIVGANGAGKSTLLLHMNGHLLPTSGFVTVGEVPLRKETRPEIRRKVGVVFQNPDDQLFMPTVFDDVAFGPLNLGLPPDRVRERVHEALRQVGALALASTRRRGARSSDCSTPSRTPRSSPRTTSTSSSTSAPDAS